MLFRPSCLTCRDDEKTVEPILVPLTAVCSCAALHGLHGAAAESPTAQRTQACSVRPWETYSATRNRLGSQPARTCQSAGCVRAFRVLRAGSDIVKERDTYSNPACKKQAFACTTCERANTRHTMIIVLACHVPPVSGPVHCVRRVGAGVQHAPAGTRAHNTHGKARRILTVELGLRGPIPRLGGVI